MCDQFINKHLSNAVAKCLDYQKSDAFLRSHLPEPEHESADDLIEAILFITLLPYLKELHRVFAKKNKQFLIFFYNSNDILSLHDLVHFRYIFAWCYKKQHFKYINKSATETVSRKLQDNLHVWRT